MKRWPGGLCAQILCLCESFHQPLVTYLSRAQNLNGRGSCYGKIQLKSEIEHRKSFLFMPLIEHLASCGHGFSDLCFLSSGLVVAVEYQQRGMNRWMNAAGTYRCQPLLKMDTPPVRSSSHLLTAVQYKQCARVQAGIQQSTAKYTFVEWGPVGTQASWT